ncbi:MAG: hypothetical protein ACRD4X_02400 [Candidatus Acidiferrales bacterium]
MVETIIWTGIALLALILWRGFGQVIFKKYLPFYSYVAAGLGGSIAVLCTYRQPGYAHWYWPIKFATLFLGSAVIWEMFARIWLPAQGLRRAARIGQSALLALLAAAVSVFVFIEAKTPVNNMAFRHLERDCRAGQAIFFVAIVSGIFYYAIPVGRNLEAICVGYGFYVFGSLVALAVWLYAGAKVAVLCDDLQPACFDIAAAIWLAGMWNPGRNLAMLSEQEADSEERRSGSGIRFQISKANLT